jgi:hypothetical protein
MTKREMDTIVVSFSMKLYYSPLYHFTALLVPES